MATLIPHDHRTSKLEVPLTMTKLRQHVGDFELMRLLSDEVMVINPGSSHLNSHATSLAGRPIHGHVILCEESEIA